METMQSIPTTNPVQADARADVAMSAEDPLLPSLQSHSTAQACTAWGSVFTMLNAAIGAGVLSFPYAFRETGLALGLVLTFVCAGLMYTTLQILVQAALRYRVHTYSQVVQRCLGKPVSLVLACITLTYQLGSCTAYMIIVGTTVRRFLVLQDLPWEIMKTRAFAVISSSVVILLPLSMPRSLGALSLLSSLTLYILIYLGILVTTHAIPELEKEKGLGHIKLVDFDHAWKAIPIIVFAFQCHVQGPIVSSELRDDASLNPCAKPGRVKLGLRDKCRLMSIICAISMSLVLIAYCVVGTFGYIEFGSSTMSNILLNYPKDDVMANIAMGGMGLVGIVSFPVNINPGKHALNHLYCWIFNKKNDPTSRSRHVLQTLLIFLVSLSLAVSVDMLGSVFHAVGGTAGALMIFVCPGLIALKPTMVRSLSIALPPEQESVLGPLPYDWWTLSKSYFLVIFGLLLLWNTLGAYL